MPYASTFITGNMRKKTLSLEVEQDISIPWIERVNKEYKLIRERFVNHGFLIDSGNFRHQLYESQRFLILGGDKL
jgi:hypothetical protein